MRCTGRYFKLFPSVDPKNVFKVIEAQYKKNEDPNNRRKQLNTPNISYSEGIVEEDEQPLRLPGK